MTALARSSDLGRRLFGGAALAFGLLALGYHATGQTHRLGYLLDALAVLQIVGGVGIQFRRFTKTGAVILGAVFLFFTLRTVPGIVTAPRYYISWGNFFEQCSLLVGAATLFGRYASNAVPAAFARGACIALGACVVSFTLEQAIYLNATAHLVPAWLPPNQAFWAVATTVAFALAAVALLTDQKPLLASRLLTLMLVGFGLLVWLPLLFADPGSHTNWSETIETFGIAGSAWILVDLLIARRRGESAPD